ncbi:ser/Thr protein phosphatase family protein [Xylaria digitata]|nr:ser/Thr protein phosphatase family protein [Xylaria digitata]
MQCFASASIFLTRILIISDTHGEVFKVTPELKADIVIHCGDLTDKFKLHEYRRTIQLLKDLDAPLKLVIAGNHDFSLDNISLRRRINEAPEPPEIELIRRKYENYSKVRQLFDEAPGITFLNEGTHKFNLHNGAFLTVYTSPCTPSEGGGNAFQYHPDTGHEFAIGADTDIVTTHGPPLGIMDRTYRGRAGCADLFEGVARARPRLHCFGHIHEDWGAKLVAWRWYSTENPPYVTDIDNDRSITIDTLYRITPKWSDRPHTRAKKLYQVAQYTQQGYCATSCCHEDGNALELGQHTVFVNAAVKGVTHSVPINPPRIVDIDLPSSYSIDAGSPENPSPEDHT